MSILDLEQNKPLEKKIENALGTKDFVVFYNDEGKYGLVQGQMSLESISMYQSLLLYMVNAAVYDIFQYDE